MTDIKPDLAISDLPDASPSDPLEALSWLGETVEEIAEGLRARGIKGTPRQPNSCPIAEYLSTWYDGWISVGPTRFDALKAGQSRSDQRNHTPYPIYMFIREFDQGAFPDLIDNG